MAAHRARLLRPLSRPEALADPVALELGKHADRDGVPAALS
jgi:hypothetical protein